MEVEVDGVDGALHLDEEVIRVVGDVVALTLETQIKVGADDALEASTFDHGRAVVAHGVVDLRCDWGLGNNGLGSLHSDPDAWCKVLGALTCDLHVGLNKGHEEGESSFKGERRGSRGRRR